MREEKAGGEGVAPSARELGVAGDAIARLRTAAQLTLSGARVADLHQANIARLERGRSLATSRTLERIAEATGHELATDFRPGVGAKG